MNGFKSVLKAAVVGISVITLLSGCEEDEVLDLAKAQKCMDNLPATITDWEAPIACANMVAKYNSQQAYIIKCAAYLTGGGLDTSRIISAAKTLDDSTNQEAIYIAALTLNKPDLSTGVERATIAKGFCNSSGVGAYIYLGNLAVMGTTLANVGIDFGTDPTTITQETINNAIAACGSDSSCLSTIADSATSVAENYCDTASTDDEVCTEINTAIEAAGGDTSKVGEAMLCYMEGKTWSNNSCT